MIFHYQLIEVMIKLFLFLLFVTVQSYSQTQEERFTKGAENGYAWLSLNQSSSTLTDYKFEYLASMLDNQRYMILYENKPKMPIGCRDDIVKLGESKNSEELDLSLMVKMIDDFYNSKENLVIPVIGAYCYCVKDLAGLSLKDLESYRQELLDFSKD
jgi:hypothetical protein